MRRAEGLFVYLTGWIPHRRGNKTPDSPADR